MAQQEYFVVAILIVLYLAMARLLSDGSIIDFFALVIGAIFVYGAAELALLTEDYDITDDTELDFLALNRSRGRLSGMSMLGYFAAGP